MELKNLKTARVRHRRGEGWSVRPECESMDGKTIPVSYGWGISEEDRATYAGETAWLLSTADMKASPKWPVWMASGDLVFEGEAP